MIEGLPRTIIIVDDQTLFRQALAQMIDLEDDLTVVAQGASGHDAIDLAGRHQPDIALLDVEMPGPPTRETIREIASRSPATRVSILTMHDEAETVRGLLGSGAHAYLAKSIARDHLLSALRSLCEQDNMHVAVSRDSLWMTPEPEPVGATLTERELDVIHCVALALSNSQIGVRLHITEGTVKRHMTNIFVKLGAVSRLDAVRKAHAARLLGMGDYAPLFPTGEHRHPATGRATSASWPPGERPSSRR